ncbi:hypothetical protein FB451DRAFT_1398142 [Mycena latifolia]|nr:hypothetical protein FB451DRAFT_1398142 [Mycena latifolia]
MTSAPGTSSESLLDINWFNLPKTVRRQARDDDGHNLVRIVMHQYNMNHQQAMNWISDLHDEIVDEFLALWESIPTFGGPLDREVRTYADGLGNWVRANDAWSFESQRYFGTQGPEIQRTRTVKMLPKRT